MKKNLFCLREICVMIQRVFAFCQYIVFEGQLTTSMTITKKGANFKTPHFAQSLKSGSNFNPQNIQYIPAVKIFAFLDFEQTETF